MNLELNLPHEPFTLFANWYEMAKEQEVSYPDAMSLATVGEKGMPSIRTVLMKSFDARGLVFYTNWQSRKGQQLALHPKASICFYWKSLKRQIHIEGTVQKVGAEEADTYFTTRPRGSQIGAWASEQSRPLKSREALEGRVREVEKKYEGKPVPRPPHWGGYVLLPGRFEFCQEQPHRLHDRIVYTQNPENAGAWLIERLYP